MVNKKLELAKEVSIKEYLGNSKKNSFFGYYDNSPWDYSQRYLLHLIPPSINRHPSPNEKAIIGYIDLENNEYRKVAKTRAWNWQMGSRLKWLKNEQNEPLFIYNDYRSGEFVSVIRHLTQGEQKVIQVPVYSVDYERKIALSLNFQRLHNLRPGYGYYSPKYKLKDYKPSEDGIYLVDLQSGEVELIIAIDELAGDIEGENHHWINHIKFNPSGNRAVFYHRYNSNEGRKTRMFTINTDGSDLYCLCDSGYISHFAWKNDEEILAWARIDDEKNYYLFKDKSQKTKKIGEKCLKEDGHPSFSPDRRWILTDTYPNKGGWKKLILYNIKENKKVEIGRFYTPIKYSGALRCDLHPRWNRDGSKVCIDSVHEGSRKMYVLNVSQIVKSGDT